MAHFCQTEKSSMGGMTTGGTNKKILCRTIHFLFASSANSCTFELSSGACVCAFDMPSSSLEIRSEVSNSEPLLEKYPTDSSEDFGRSSCHCHQSHSKSLYKRSIFWVCYLNTILLVTAILLFIRRPGPISPQKALKVSSAYSPLFDLVDLSPIPVKVDGRLHVSPNASIYRGDPSPSTDAAWDALAAEANEVILVNSTTLSRAGYNPSHYFKAPASWDAGDDSFPVQIDVFHQIHCLNALRKQMHYDYYFGKEFGEKGPDEMHWMHMKHCLHMVLQSLTCNANVDIVPHRWVEQDEVPFAQFGIVRQCRNFEALSDWNQGHAVRNVRDVWGKAKRPDDAFVWPGYGE